MSTTNLCFKNEIKQPLDFNDDKEGVKISLPNKKAYYKGDKEITKNMQMQIWELLNPTLEIPVMNISDEDINNDFFNEFHLSFDGINSMDGDSRMNLLFFIQQIGNLSSATYQIADNQINEDFYLNFFSKQNKCLYLAADKGLTLNFFKENAE